MTPRRAGAALFVVGAVVAGVVTRANPDARAMYEGACTGEGYRSLHGGGIAPASIDKTETVNAGEVPGIVLATDEQPPQAQLLVQDSSILVPPGVTQVIASVRPVDPPPDLPQGVLGSNVYNIAVTTPAGAPLSLRSGLPAIVVLRGFGVSKDSAIELHPLEGSGWTSLQSTPLGCSIDTLNANATVFGLFAVVNPRPPVGQPGGAGLQVAALVVGTLLLAGILVLLTRLRPPRR